MTKPDDVGRTDGGGSARRIETGGKPKVSLSAVSDVRSTGEEREGGGLNVLMSSPKEKKAPGRK